MPLNVRRFCTSVLLVFLAFTTISNAQTPAPATNGVQAPAPTSGDVMRERISRAKAFIAVRNYNAAIYELESIRKETNDQSVQAVTNVLLMNSYLEQSDYKRAQEFLNEFYRSYKSNNAHSAVYYYAVAGQIVAGARNRAERYRALGLNVSDRNLPLEAVNDIEKMRETLELVVTQSKEASADKAKAPQAMALLEEASSSRSLLARDDYDARRWKNEIGDAREQMASSRSVVLNAVNAPGENVVAQNTSAVTAPAASEPAASGPAFKPVADTSPKPAPAETRPAADEQKKQDEAPKAESSPAPRAIKIVGRQNEAKPEAKPAPAAEKKEESPKPAAAAGPMEVGSLIGYATKQSQPVYPPAARNLRTTGVVKVDITVDENGDVTEIDGASGPALLQTAAKDAIRKWKFRPFVREGQPVRAKGFINFNFSL